MGRLMLANWPPLGCSQVHTFGRTYSVIAIPSLRQPARGLGRRRAAFQCQACNSAGAFRQERRKGAVPVAADVLHDGRGGGGLQLGFLSESRFAPGLALRVRFLRPWLWLRYSFQRPRLGLPRL